MRPLFIIALLLLFSACGDSEEPKAEQPPPTQDRIRFVDRGCYSLKCMDIWSVDGIEYIVTDNGGIVRK
jgi:hypothetical protein